MSRNLEDLEEMLEEGCALSDDPYDDAASWDHLVEEAPSELARTVKALRAIQYECDKLHESVENGAAQDMQLGVAYAVNRIRAVIKSSLET